MATWLRLKSLCINPQKFQSSSFQSSILWSVLFGATNHFRKKKNSNVTFRPHLHHENSHRSPHMAGMITLMVADITTWWCLGSLRISVLGPSETWIFSQNHFLFCWKTKTLRFFGDEKIWVFTKRVNKCHVCFILNHFIHARAVFLRISVLSFGVFSEASRTGLPHSP